MQNLYSDPQSQEQTLAQIMRAKESFDIETMNVVENAEGQV